MAIHEMKREQRKLFSFENPYSAKKKKKSEIFYFHSCSLISCTSIYYFGYIVIMTIKQSEKFGFFVYFFVLFCFELNKTCNSAMSPQCLAPCLALRDNYFKKNEWH